MVMHTSASTSSARRIFFDKGKPLYIYLATDVENHTTLVNNLRASGASTPFSPGDAQIILVAPGTQVASELLHAFPNKLFLDVEWALSALRTGSFASQNEGWGGYLVHPRRSEMRDGVSSSISPLPTPRRTPIPMSDGQLPQQQTPVNVLDPATVLAYLSQAIGAVPAANPAMGPQVPMPAFQLPPGVTLPFLLPPGIPPAPQPGPVNQQPAPSPDIVNSLAQLLRAAQDQSSRNQFQAHQWPSQGVSSSLLNASFPFTQTASHYAPLQPSSDSDLANTIMNALRSSASAGSASASLKRKSRQDSSDLATSEGGGEDAGMGHNTKHERMDEDFPSDGPKHVGRSGHNKRIFTDDDGSMLHFYVSPSLHNRPKIVDHIKKHGGKITADVPESHFVVLSNNSDHFYETLRSAVASDVPAVKADFIMESIRAKSLLDPAEFSFDGDTLRRKRGTPIVIDLAEIRRETHGERKQKGKRPRNAGGEHVRNSVESEDDDERSSDRVQKPSSSSHKGSKKSETAVPKARPKITKRRKTNEIRAEYKTPRSPSPIAPNTVVEVGGKHRFTEEEREYWPKYAAHVLKYDPSCTLTKFSQLLAAKMPHHTGPSWFTAILTPNRAKIEDLRKRAFIDARKADALKPHLNLVESGDQREDEAKVQESRPPVPVPRGRSMDLEQDMEIVTQFIMDGGADNIPDDADVWKALEEQHSCRTQKTWEVFWEEHGEEVTREVQDRSAVNAEVKVEPDA